MLRGIAIIMVVTIHCFGIVYSDGLLDFAAVVSRNILNCAVPIFCVSSAYFLYSKDLTYGKYVPFLKRQIPKVYLPMLFFSLGWLLLDLSKGQSIIKGVARLIFCDYSMYYFVAVVIQFYLLLPLLKKMQLGGVKTIYTYIHFVIGMIFTIAYMLCYTYIIRGYYHLDVSLLLYAGPILCHWIYFVLGCMLSKKSPTLPAKILILLVALSVVLMYYESCFLMTTPGSLSGVGIKGSSVLYSTFICMLLFANPCKCENAVSLLIAKLGRYSFGIYLSHVFIIHILGKITADVFFRIFR